MVLVGAARQWLPDLKALAQKLKVNAGSEPGTDIGPVISRRARQRIVDLIDSGVREGATLELPHILVLIDDLNRTVIEPLGAAK